MNRPARSVIAALLLSSTLASSLLTARPARADDDPRARSGSWQTVTTVTALAALGTQLLVPRTFYSDPETTVGWKGRWHVSALAPVMTIAGLVLVNEVFLKDAVASRRPGCDDATQGGIGCKDYQALSSHAFAGFAAFGHGTAVFLVDMTKWSGGRFNAASFTGDVVLPLVLAGVTSVGRGAGKWESTGDVIVSSVAGLGVGALLGLTYAVMQRPECGYTGDLICW